MVLFLLGLFIYRFIISKVMTGPPLAQLVVTFGVSIFIANAAALVWTPNFRSIESTLLSGIWDVQGIRLGVPKVVSSIGSVITSLGVFWFLRSTRTGKAILAVEMDREAALMMGINTERINSLCFGIGSALVGVAGALLATHYYIYPFVGGSFGLISASASSRSAGSAASKGRSSRESWSAWRKRWAASSSARPTSLRSFSRCT